MLCYNKLWYNKQTKSVEYEFIYKHTQKKNKYKCGMVLLELCSLHEKQTNS